MTGSRPMKVHSHLLLFHSPANVIIRIGVEYYGGQHGRDGGV
jgi:hypothetical protein